MLMELSKVEQRYDAVLAVIRDGLTISEATPTPCALGRTQHESYSRPREASRSAGPAPGRPGPVDLLDGFGDAVGGAVVGDRRTAAGHRAVVVDDAEATG